MDNVKKVPLKKLTGHGCFACGTANPIGLNMKFYRYENFVCSEIILGKQYEGWENMAHGGIISTLLDEVMSWTIIYFKRDFFVTRKMEVKYIRPVSIEEPIVVRGRIQEENERSIKARGELLDKEGKILARSVGEFVFVPEERLSNVSERLKQEMKDLFKVLDS